MKIAIPVTDQHSGKNTMASGLNVLGFLCVFDTLTREGQWIKTMDLAPNMGELLPALERNCIQAIITRQIHPMALKVLVDRGVQVFRSDGAEVDKNIELFCNKQLPGFDMNAAMSFAKVCGGECDHCETDCDDTK